MVFIEVQLQKELADLVVDERLGNITPFLSGSGIQQVEEDADHDDDRNESLSRINRVKSD